VTTTELEAMNEARVLLEAWRVERRLERIGRAFNGDRQYNEYLHVLRQFRRIKDSPRQEATPAPEQPPPHGEDRMEMTCPKCGSELYIERQDLESGEEDETEVACPRCGHTFIAHHSYASPPASDLDWSNGPAENTPKNAPGWRARFYKEFAAREAQGVVGKGYITRMLRA
jgi:predicted Zn finger-like uncharacterized protein